MKTKIVESTETVQPAVAKPVNKAVAAPKPVTKKLQPEVQAIQPEKALNIVKPDKEAKMELKVTKKPKLKVVRDSFTMPQSEYLKITEIKELCLKAGMQVKKSEVLRAGVIALGAMSDKQLQSALSALDKIKTGRPNKAKPV